MLRSALCPVKQMAVSSQWYVSSPRHLLCILCLLLQLWRCICILRLDCHPDANATVLECGRRGCIWSPIASPQPSCIFVSSPTEMAGYNVMAWKFEDQRSFRACLQRRRSPTLFGNDYEYVQISLQQLSTCAALSIKFEPEFAGCDDEGPDEFIIFRMEAFFEVTIKSRPFGLSVYRDGSKQLLFDTTDLPGLTFSELFSQITTRSTTRKVYGFGQHYHTDWPRAFDWQRLAMFTVGFKPTQGMNSYGFHPFHLALDEKNSAYGIYVNSTYGMEVCLQPAPNLITYRLMGGRGVHVLVFAGPDADRVVAQYTHSTGGRPSLPPRWGLGFQLSRFGYKNMSMLRAVWDRNRRALIPQVSCGRGIISVPFFQDVQYVDADYMDNGRDYTLDETNFGELPQFAQQNIHDEYERKLVLIVDPAISAEADPSSYEPLHDGRLLNVFVRDNRTGEPIVGSLWPGRVYLPDFVTHPNTSRWWAMCIRRFHLRIPFDGLWLDENEPTSFSDGSESGCALNAYNRPPFSAVPYKTLFKHTFCLDADFYVGKHSEHHNVYALHEAVATDAALNMVFPNRRPFVLSRSSSPGMGKRAAVWMAFLSIFGLAWSGTDICGFEGDVSEELCLRWSQLGAFYPFSRNHNSNTAKQDQDPAAWPVNTATAIRKALLLRYALLPYLYSLFYRAHLVGSSVVRPLFFAFPNDTVTHTVHDQFLWGGGLMIAPILEPSSVVRQVYLPRSKWYNVMDDMRTVSNGSAALTYTALIPNNSIGVFLRGGFVVPSQKPALSTKMQTSNPFGATVALDEEGRAQGELYWDDGVSSDTVIHGRYCHVQFSAAQNHLIVALAVSGCPALPHIGTIRIAGVDGDVNAVRIDSVPHQAFSYDRRTAVLTIDHLHIDIVQTMVAVVEWTIMK